MKPKEYETWTKRRKDGMAKFVLVTGVLSWGVPMCVFMGFFNGGVLADGALTGMDVVHVLIWLIGGAGFGSAMWVFAERRYRKASGEHRTE